MIARTFIDTLGSCYQCNTARAEEGVPVCFGAPSKFVHRVEAAVVQRRQ